MSMKEKHINYLIIFLMGVILTMCVGCAGNAITGVPLPHEMTGEPVNISLLGQVEMCEREPESILCEEAPDE